MVCNLKDSIMPEYQGIRIPWSESSGTAFTNIVHITETICTPFATRQFQLLGLLPAVDGHPRVLDNACGSGRQTETLCEAYADAGRAIDITCCDISPAMIGLVERRIKDRNWTNVKTVLVSAEARASKETL